MQPSIIIIIIIVHGNVRVILNKPVLITPTKRVNEVIIPVYNTKRVSKNKEPIPDKVIRVYGREWNIG